MVQFHPNVGINEVKTIVAQYGAKHLEQASDMSNLHLCERIPEAGSDILDLIERFGADSQVIFAYGMSIK
jgi:hypothetical protein